MLIKSVLDNDLYKFSMSYAYMRCFPDAEGVFEFTDRDKEGNYTQEFLELLNREFYSLKNLKLTDQEFEWATKRLGRYIPEHYWEWLKGWNFDPSKIKMDLKEGEGGNKYLKIYVTDKLYRGTLYEVMILAMVSELKNKLQCDPVDMGEMLHRLDEKIELSNREELYFSEFGTRRRFSQHVQEEVCKRLKEKATYCTGTSNVYLAMKYDMTPIGTVAHEWTMFHAAQYGYRQANYMALENWINVYDGDLGTALTDTFTSKVFFDNFSRKHAKLYDGVRHDSGDPYKYITMAVNRYKELGVDPRTKSIIFSNALTMPEFKDISDCCRGRVKIAAAGIGTNLTNDTGNKPLNIVMKLVRCRMNSKKSWIDCVKVSDDLGKHMGESKELKLCYDTLGLGDQE